MDQTWAKRFGKEVNRLTCTWRFLCIQDMYANRSQLEHEWLSVHHTCPKAQDSTMKPLKLGCKPKETSEHTLAPHASTNKNNEKYSPTLRRPDLQFSVLPWSPRRHLAGCVEHVSIFKANLQCLDVHALSERVALEGPLRAPAKQLRRITRICSLCSCQGRPKRCRQAS